MNYDAFKLVIVGLCFVVVCLAANSIKSCVKRAELDRALQECEAGQNALKTQILGQKTAIVEAGAKALEASEKASTVYREKNTALDEKAKEDEKEMQCVLDTVADWADTPVPDSVCNYLRALQDGNGIHSNDSAPAR